MQWNLVQINKFAQMCVYTCMFVCVCVCVSFFPQLRYVLTSFAVLHPWTFEDYGIVMESSETRLECYQSIVSVTFCFIFPHCASRTELRCFLGIHLLIVISFPAATDRIRVSSIRVSSSRQWWISGRRSTSKRPQHAVWDMNAICKSINMLMILLTVTSLIILLLH